jgi:mono/diheme cytochrome c family protein
MSETNSSLNQLEALEEAGYLTLPQPASALPKLLRAELDSDDLTREVREYLQVNCASCHRPEGVSHLSFDLRANIPLSEAGLCDALPVLGDLGIPDARLLVPGAPERSLLLTRMRERGPEQMPPLGSNIVDYEGIALVTFWISQLEGCE